MGSAAPAGTGWRNSFDAFSHVTLRTTSGGHVVEPGVRERLRVGPGGVGVRVVALEADVVDADVVAQRERRADVDRAEPEVAAQRVDRRDVGIVPAVRADRGVVEHVVDAVDQHRHPADAALGERDLDVREAGRDARPQPVGRGDRARSPGTGSCTARAARPASAPRSTTTSRCAGTRPSRSPRTRAGTGSQ